MRRIIVAGLAAAACLLGGSGIAHASSGLPFYQVVNGQQNGECIVTNGSYNQVTLGTSGCGSFYVSVVGQKPNGNDVVTIQDGSGNCLAANNNGTQTEIKPGACSTSNNTEVWVDSLANQGIDDTYWIDGTNGAETMGTDSQSTGTGVDVEASPAYDIWG